MSPREGPRSQGTKCGVDRGEKRHRTNACVGLGALELTERVGALDSDQAAISGGVAEAKREQLTSPEAGPERDVEEMDVKEIRFVSEVT